MRTEVNKRTIYVESKDDLRFLEDLEHYVFGHNEIDFYIGDLSESHILVNLKIKSGRNKLIQSIDVKVSCGRDSEYNESILNYDRFMTIVKGFVGITDLKLPDVKRPAIQDNCPRDVELLSDLFKKYKRI